MIYTTDCILPTVTYRGTIDFILPIDNRKAIHSILLLEEEPQKYIQTMLPSSEKNATAIWYFRIIIVEQIKIESKAVEISLGNS